MHLQTSISIQQIPLKRKQKSKTSFAAE